MMTKLAWTATLLVGLLGSSAGAIQAESAESKSGFAKSADGGLTKYADKPTLGLQTPQERDAQLTIRIRQDLINNPELSMESKNIYVSTENNVVVVNGEVPTQREKDIIVDIARSVAKGAIVRDELKVVY